MNDESGYRLWLDKAANDLLNIENNLAAQRVPWDTVCFHAQQAAEKVLKACLIFHQRRAPRSHDLVALLTHCATFAPELTALEEDCRNLTYYSVGARYPDNLYEPTEEEGYATVAAAKRVHAKVLDYLKTAPKPT